MLLKNIVQINSKYDEDIIPPLLAIINYFRTCVYPIELL